MEQWNREELYADVWELPLTKLQEKYGISNVAMGKACRKLKVPLPGGGYWARKQAGQNVRRVPLPPAKDLPVVWRMKLPDSGAPKPEVRREPTDPEWQRIRDMESRRIEASERPRYHPIITETRKQLATARQNIRGILEPHGMEILDVRVSKRSVDRALRFLNEVLRTLEAERFRLKPGREYRQRVRAEVFGQEVSFAVAERSKVVARREIKKSAFGNMTERDYEATGRLEFRVGALSWTPEPVLADTPKQKLESMVAQAVAAIMRKGREQLIWEEKRRQEGIAELKRTEENARLAEKIRAEEKKVREFESWVDAWSRAARMREFVEALENVWKKGSDILEGSERAQKLLWMRQQADRIDPLVFEKPQSILDRKGELRSWEYRE